MHMCMSYFPMHCQACHGCALDEEKNHANSAELGLASLHRRPRPTAHCATTSSLANCQRRRLSQQPCCEPSETLANCFVWFFDDFVPIIRLSFFHGFINLSTCNMIYLSASVYASTSLSSALPIGACCSKSSACLSSCVCALVCVVRASVLLCISNALSRLPSDAVDFPFGFECLFAAAVSSQALSLGSLPRSSWHGISPSYERVWPCRLQRKHGGIESKPRGSWWLYLSRGFPFALDVPSWGWRPGGSQRSSERCRVAGNSFFGRPDRNGACAKEEGAKEAGEKRKPPQSARTRRSATPRQAPLRGQPFHSKLRQLSFCANRSWKKSIAWIEARSHVALTFGTSN